jgi:hypothetical protein
MPTNVPTPFPDLDIPPRTDDQKQADRDRNREQVSLLAEGASPGSDGQGDEQPSAASASEEGLDELLIARRAGATGVLQVETAPTDNERSSLVVPGQLLVRHPVDSDALPPDVDLILRESDFEADTPGGGSRVCPELAERLTAYTYTGYEDARIDNTQIAVDRLQGRQDGVKATPTLVTALHQGPVAAFGGTVVKAAVGPAPTKVDDSDQEFARAGFRLPQGNTIVAVIDTGIAAAERSDGWLNEVRRTERNIDPLDRFRNGGNGLLDFAAGHGTFAAGIVRLVDPHTKIRAYAALDSDGFASENAVACAMIRAVKDGAHVLNLSNGMHTVDNAPSVAFEQALKVIDEIAASQGRGAPAIVASAGNYGDTRKVWPAAFTDRVISVAALTAELKPAKFSSRGSWVTCSCVGQGIVSTFVEGTEDQEFFDLRSGSGQPDTYPLPDQSDPWAVWSGTSFAAPQIAGAISRTMREEGGIPPRTASHVLLARGESITDFGQALLLLPGT